MFERIDEEIKKYNKIVFGRHQNPDLDAFGSQLALKYSLSLVYPDKKLMVVGAKPSAFSFLPIMDKEEVDDDTLLIVTDVPNISRIDVKDYSKYKNVIKMDHHEYMDKMGDIEIVDTNVSSACELVYFFLKDRGYPIDSEIAKFLYMGIICDTGRFSYSVKDKTFMVVSDLYRLIKDDIKEIYMNIYKKDLNYMKYYAELIKNMSLTTNGLAFQIVEGELLDKYDNAIVLSGNIINEFTFVKEYLIWTIATYDKTKEIYKISIRSKGPIINKIAEKYNGGGHALASGARISTKEEVLQLFKELDLACERYNNENK